MSGVPPPPVLIIRIPFERPQDGGLNDPTPIDWTPEKERLLWQELSTARAGGHSEVDWQALSTRLECSLPYLLYKTQARYEEDLRRIHEIRPIVSTAALPQTPQDSNRATAPSLTRRVSHTESISTAQYTKSPRRADRPLLQSTHSSSHIPSPRPLPHALPPTRLSEGGQTQEESGGGGGDDGDDGEANDAESSSESSGTEQDEVERKREEQESLGRKLRELGRLMSSDMLGFARPPTRTSPTTATATGRPSTLTGTLRGLPERPSDDDERQQPTRPVVTTVDRSRERGGPEAQPSSQPSRVSRFAREVPDIPSSGSSSPGERNPTVPHHSAPQAPQNASRHRSVSSQGSQASSFSDFSDASLSASALEEDAMFSRAAGTSRISSMFTRNGYGRGRGHF